jgi:tRNA nucleotidyltransferase (CCA-adding enzyme)
MDLSAAATVRLFDRCDAWRKPQQFNEMLLACECDARGRLGLQDQPYPQAPRLRAALALAQAVDTASVAALAASRGQTGPAIGAAIHAARVQVVAAQATSSNEA